MRKRSALSAVKGRGGHLKEERMRLPAAAGAEEPAPRREGGKDREGIMRDGGGGGGGGGVRPPVWLHSAHFHKRTGRVQGCVYTAPSGRAQLSDSSLRLETDVMETRALATHSAES